MVVQARLAIGQAEHAEQVAEASVGSARAQVKVARASMGRTTAALERWRSEYERMEKLVRDRVVDRQSGEERKLELEGITIKNRLVLVYSKNDMITQLKQVSDPFGNGYDAETCRKLAVNVVAYALQN